MKILFVQLAKQDASGDAAFDNVPHAAARLAAYAESRGALARPDYAFLDQDAADFGGDAAVASAVVGSRADVVAFTLFDWNLDRSVWLARRIRALMPATHFAALGPEVVQGMAVFKAQAFDALIEGEAEEPFVALLADVEARSIQPRYAADRPLELATTPDPYLAGVLPISADKPVIIESARGASRPCALWNRGELRLFPRDTAPRVLRLASEKGALDARFIDARLDDRPDFAGFAKSLAAANEAGVALRASLGMDAVSDELAGLLADAALATADAELGSTNPVALEAVGLALDKPAFERSAQTLWNRGIVVKPALYLGLPGDSYETTVDTFDFLGMAGLGQDAELQPVALQPGTVIRTMSEGFGIRECLERPPYWVIETETMDEDDFLDAVADFEESFDVAWGAPVTPSFQRERGGFIAFADARSGGDLDGLLVSPEKAASSVTLLLDADDPERATRVARAARDLRKENPYTLWQIVLYSNARIPDAATAMRLADAFAMPEHYFELSRLYSLDPQPDFQTRVFFATSSEALALTALREEQRLETIFVLGDSMPGARLVEALPFLAFDRDAVPFELLYDVMSAWRVYPDLLLEAPKRLFG